MMISKTKISAENFEKVNITKDMSNIFGLPQKAIGIWAIVGKNHFQYRLVKVREDGYFACDKYNNHQGISMSVWERIFGNKRSVEYELSKECTRKKNWILKLVEELNKIPELAITLKRMEYEDVILKILDDTSSARPQGKAYSSIDTAITYWKYKYGSASK